MPLTRRFLGNERPALYAAAEILLLLPDLSRAIVAVPGARAAKRLAEVLAWFHEQSGAVAPLTLPRIVTAGELPEQLMRPGAVPVASASEALAARAGALRGMDAEGLRCVFPSPPERGDAGGWLRLARELEALDEELSGERVEYASVAAYCDAHAPRGEAERWRCLERVDALARERLRAAGKVGRSEARRAALEDASGDGLRRGLSVVLLGTIDLSALAGDMVRAVSGTSECVALVFAPESEADGFDYVGRLVAGYWPARVPEMEEGQLRIVDTAREQGYAALEACRRLEEMPDDGITVALGDAALAPMVERSLSAGGRRARREVASRLGSSGPVTLLQALADFAEQRSSAAWASLARHPDLAAYLSRQWGSQADAARLPEISDTLRVLSLPGSADAPAPARLLRDNDKDGLQAKAVAAVTALLDASAPDGGSRAARPLASWPESITHMLAALYGGREFSAGQPADDAPAQALQSLGRRAGEIASVPAVLSEEMGMVTLPQAMRWLAAQVAAEPVFTRSDESVAAIEITGWLDALLDDAPALIVAGFNEGSIPETLPGDGLLPETARIALGLPSNQRRLSRDAYTLAALLASRDVSLIAGRFSPAGEPLAPSRLCFTGAGEADIAATALRFYSEGRREQPPAPPDTICAETDTLACLPKPVPLDEPISRLPVTAFRDYLACPYRFYLKHVLKLAAVDDARVEIEGDLFGTLAHATLAEFGKWVIREREGATPPIPEMRRFLSEALDKAAANRLAPSSLPVAAVQVERLRRRLLGAFVNAQSLLADDGWMILYAEEKLEHNIAVDGTPFLAYGRVDRIDYHPATSVARVIDYKTADSAKTPRETHCPRGEWLDLQLPVYQRIAACLDDALAPETIECGYFNLPRRAGEAGFEPAVWHTKTTAPPNPAGVIDEVVRGIRSGRFWPPSETLPAYDDGLAAICLDGVLNRGEIIRRDAGQAAVWEVGKKEAESL